jgi:hypothetical protein
MKQGTSRMRGRAVLNNQQHLYVREDRLASEFKSLCSNCAVLNWVDMRPEALSTEILDPSLPSHTVKVGGAQ